MAGLRGRRKKRGMGRERGNRGTEESRGSLGGEEWEERRRERREGGRRGGKRRRGEKGGGRVHSIARETIRTELTETFWDVFRDNFSEDFVLFCDVTTLTDWSIIVCENAS